MRIDHDERGPRIGLRELHGRDGGVIGANHRRVTRREFLPTCLRVERPERFVTDHGHLHGAVAVEVVEEHDGRVEIAGHMDSNSEMRPGEAVLEADQPNAAAVGLGWGLPAGGAGHLRSGDALEQLAEPRVPAEVVLVHPERNRSARATVHHEDCHSAAARGRQQDPARTVASIVANVQDRRSRILPRAPTAGPRGVATLDRRGSKDQDLVAAVSGDVANQDRFGGDSRAPQVDRPRDARRLGEAPLER